jgi:hypothetical protein
MELTQENLKDVLHYDPETGNFTRLKNKGSKSPSVGTLLNGYLRIGVGQKIYAAHRLAWLYMTGSFPSGQIDHINGNKLDNRFVNLRVATASENKQNMRKARRGSRSGLIGASWHTQSQKWRAAIQIDGKKKHLGYFNTAEEAHLVFLEHKRRHHPFCTL